MASEKTDVRRTKKVSRRKFLGISTAAAAGAIAGAGVAAGVGGYFAGQSTTPGPGAPRTVTVTTTQTATVTTTQTPTETATTTPAPERTEIRLGTTIPLTGLFAAFGEEEKVAFTWAVDALNEQGGVLVPELGRSLPLRLIIYDDESDLAKSATNVNKLILDDKVDFILGELGLPQEQALAAAESYQTVYIGPIYPLSFKSGQYKWMISPFHDETDEAEVFFGWLKTLPADQQPTKVAIWEEAGDISAEVNADAGRAVAQRLGFPIVLEEKYEFGSDPTPFLLRAKEVGVDMIWGLPSPPAAVDIVKKAKEVDYTPKAWGFTRGTAVGFFGFALGSDSEYVFAIFGWHPDVNYPGAAPLVERYRTEIGQEPFLLGIYYSQVLLIKEGIEQAGSLDKTKIRAALSQVDIQTPAGRLAFDENGKWIYSRDHTMIFQWRNGKLVIVWPDQLKTADPVYPTPPWSQRGAY